jgi:hypothetical protein
MVFVRRCSFWNIKVLVFFILLLLIPAQADNSEPIPKYNFSQLKKTPEFRIDVANATIHTKMFESKKPLVGGIFRVTLPKPVNVGVKNAPASVFINAVIVSCSADAVLVIQSIAANAKGERVSTTSEVFVLPATDSSTPAAVIYGYLCDGNIGQRRYT